MKTIPELNKELKDISYQIQNEGMKPAAEKRLRKRIPFIKTCIMYLEEKPNPTYIREKIKDLQAKIVLRMNLFCLDDYADVDKKTVNQLRRAHEKKYEVPHLKDQVKTLKFLLKD